MDSSLSALFNLLITGVECATALLGFSVLLLVILSFLPYNPVQLLLKGIAKRLALTAAVALVGVPLQPVPGLDEIYDIVGLILVGLYWFSLFRPGQPIHGMPLITRTFQNLIKKERD